MEATASTLEPSLATAETLHGLTEPDLTMRYVEGGYPLVAYGVARELLACGQPAEAERLLLQACLIEEAQAEREKRSVRAILYERLAILYRETKRLEDEIAILERFAAQRHATGSGAAKLLARLEKARAKR